MHRGTNVSCSPPLCSNGNGVSTSCGGRDCLSDAVIEKPTKRKPIAVYMTGLRSRKTDTMFAATSSTATERTTIQGSLTFYLIYSFDICCLLLHHMFSTHFCKIRFFYRLPFKESALG